MLGTPYQTKLTFLANLSTILRILLQWKLDYDKSATLINYLERPSRGVDSRTNVRLQYYSRSRNPNLMNGVSMGVSSGNNNKIGNRSGAPVPNPMSFKRKSLHYHKV